MYAVIVSFSAADEGYFMDGIGECVLRDDDFVMIWK